MVALPASRRPRAGFSMIEMIFAVSITVLVFSIAIPFFRAQTRAMDAGAGKLDAFQSARYAVARIEADLRFAGGEAGQPVIVQAAPFAIAFNANRQGRTLPSGLPSDPNASYSDPSFVDTLTLSWAVSRARTLPNSSKTYPTRAYTTANGTTSPAETIQYFLHADTSGGRTNQYVLYRRLNNGDSTLVTRGLYVASDSSFFFRYYTTNAAGTTTAVANASTPIYWDDSLSRDDSVSAVQIRATGVYYDAKAQLNVYRQLYSTVKLRNAFKLLPINCGAVPATPSSLGVVIDSAGGSLPMSKLDVRLSWTAVAGDSTAPRDVRQYIVYRRLSSATTWTPIGSKPARAALNYQYLDFALPVVAGTYQYGVAARDCSGLSAVRLGTSAVVFP